MRFTLLLFKRGKSCNKNINDNFFSYEYLQATLMNYMCSDMVLVRKISNNKYTVYEK